MKALVAMLVGAVLAVGCGPTGSQEAAATLSRQSMRATPKTTVAAGRKHAMSLRPNGEVWAWGSNDRGQIGNAVPIHETDVYGPQKVNISGVTGIWAGASRSLAIKSDGTLWIWGESYSATPQKVSTWTDVVAVAAGGGHILALRGNGEVWAFGANGSGQLGDGTTVGKSIPVKVGGLPNSLEEPVVAVAAGGAHSLAVTQHVQTGVGRVWAWGNNVYGQLGDGSTTQRLSPVEVYLVRGGATLNGFEVGAGEYASFAVASDGSLWAWGLNSFGHLGDGTKFNRSTPVAVAGPLNVRMVASGDTGNYSSIALGGSTTLPEVWTWGDNASGQLGDGQSYCPNGGSPTVNVPSKIALYSITSVASSTMFAIAQSDTGVTWVWGWNAAARLGTGVAGGCAKAPQQVPGLP